MPPLRGCVRQQRSKYESEVAGLIGKERKKKLAQLYEKNRTRPKDYQRPKKPKGQELLAVKEEPGAILAPPVLHHDTDAEFSFPHCLVERPQESIDVKQQIKNLKEELERAAARKALDDRRWQARVETLQKQLPDARRLEEEVEKLQKELASVKFQNNDLRREMLCNLRVPGYQ